MTVDRAAFDQGAIKSVGTDSSLQSVPPAYSGYSTVTGSGAHESNVEVALMYDVGNNDQTQLYAIPADRGSFKSSGTGSVASPVSNPIYCTPGDDGSVYVIPRDDTCGETGASDYLDVPGATSAPDQSSDLQTIYSSYSGADLGIRTIEPRDRLSSTV